MGAASRPRRRRFPQGIVLALLLCSYGCLLLMTLFLAASFSPKRIDGQTLTGATTITASDGTVLATLTMRHSRPVSLDEVPTHTIYAVLAAEDVRFFRHRGLDLRGILRALWMDIKTWSIRQGGSTITQQLARIAVLHDRRTFTRKIRETVLALRIERCETKREILHTYLNTTYFGGGAYGIDLAARSYFRKPVSALTPAESALLAGLIREPTGGNPRTNLVVAQRRQRAILATMRSQGWLTETAYRAALREAPTIHPRLAPPAWHAPYAVERIRQSLLAQYGADAVYGRRMTVVTTLDPGMQQAAERALRGAVSAGRGRRVGNGAVVALDPRTGEIRALVGGTHFFTSQFNRATQAHRQPGSSFKVFVYLAAIEQGHLLSDIAWDHPMIYGTWRPSNYGSQYHGTVTLRTALAQSLNSVAVQLTAQMGPETVIQAAHRAGIDSRLRPDLALALGASEVTPLEMARAFATLANGGTRVTPYLIREIRWGEAVIFRAIPAGQRTISPATAYLLTDGLTAVLDAGTGRRARIGRPAAGKTGTSNAYRDAWFVGFTPDLCAAVWLGNDDRRPMAGVAGGSLPAQAWASFMRTALRDVPARDFIMPADVRPVTLCTQTHLLALPTCPHITVLMPLSRVPTQTCPAHYWVTRAICRESGLPARPDCPTVEARFPYNRVPSGICPLSHLPAAPPPVIAPERTEPPALPPPRPAIRPPRPALPPPPPPPTPPRATPPVRPQPPTPPTDKPAASNPFDKRDQLPPTQSPSPP